MSETDPSSDPAAQAANRRRRRATWVFVIVIVVAALGLHGVMYWWPPSPPRDWLADLDEAMALAAKENRRVVALVVHRSMGDMSRDLIRFVIEKPANRAAMKDGNCVGVLVRLRGDLGRRVEETYKVTTTPTLLLLDAKGREITRREGGEALKEVPFREEFLKGR